MALDEWKGTLQEKRNGRVLNKWIEGSKERLIKWNRETSSTCLEIWSGEEKDFLAGPSKKWWKERLVKRIIWF
jgi:hypothetical protein